MARASNASIAYSSYAVVNTTAGGGVHRIEMVCRFDALHAGHANIEEDDVG